MEALRREFKRFADGIEKSMDDFKGETETDFKKKQGMNSMKNERHMTYFYKNIFKTDGTFNFIVNIKSTFSQSIPTSVSILKKIKKIIPRSSNTRHIGNIAPLTTLPQILVVSNSFF